MNKPFKLSIAVFSLAVIIFGITTWLRDRHVVPIMMYHRVNEDIRLSASVSPENFKKQMEYLKSHGYNVISLDRLVTSLRQKTPLPSKSVVITFDDGFEDNYTQAFTILKEYGFPATIFLIVSMIDQKDFLTTQQIREMEQNQITFASHTVSHMYLPEAPVDQQAFQITESKRLLERKLGHRVDYFAYPSGGFSNQTKEIVQKAGYQAACTTNRGAYRFNEDLFELKRVSFRNKDYTWSMLAKLSGYYNLFRKETDSY